MTPFLANAHPFAAAAPASGWKHPDFCLEKRYLKTASSVNSLPSQFPQVRFPPDEEKGRPFRSNNSRSMSTSSMFGDSSSAASKDFLMLDDGVSALTVEDDAGKSSSATDSALASIFFDELDLDVRLEAMTPAASPTMVNWTKLLAEAIEFTRESIDLSFHNLTEIPDDIWELSTMRKIPDPRLGVSSLNRLGSTRTFGKTQSGPLPFPSGVENGSRRTFSRTLSGSFVEPIRASVPINLNLSNNDLSTHSISNALFDVQNLQFLSLRQNRLEHLPEGIGRLTGLVELSVAGNQLKYLPAEMLQLTSLVRVTVRPNPFLSPPKDPQTYPSSRILGPLVVHYRVPSLYESCVRYLLAAQPGPSPAQAKIMDYEIPSYLTNEMLAPFVSTLFPPSNSGSRRQMRSRTTSGSLGSSWASDETPAQPYDSRQNICRSPAHSGQEKIFYRPAVERMEWVSEKALVQAVQTGRNGTAGPKTIPIRHRGCSANCLDWLESA